MPVLLVSTWIYIRRGHRHSCQRPSRLVGALLLPGVVPVRLGDGVGDCHDVANLAKESVFLLYLSILGERKLCLFQGVAFFTFGYC